MIHVETEESLLVQCKLQIEEKLGWGSSALWTNQDFETLSERILTETGVNLSPATLKRLWGKIRYNSKPTTTTLDTLARFLGYENWREFRREKDVTRNGHDHDVEVKQPTVEVVDIPVAVSVPPSSKKKGYITLGIMIAGVLMWMLFTGSDRTSERKGIPGDKDKYQFSSRKMVNVGVPNSVIFQYDARQATGNDNVVIQQSWDTLLRQEVDPQEQTHTSIYYYPGYFKAKLMVNNTIVNEHDLFIQTDGWLPLVEHEPVPVYFKNKELIHDGMLSLPVGMLNENHVSLQPNTPWVSFFYMKEMKGLKTDDFVLEAVLKNDYSEGAAACQNTEVHLRLDGGVLVVPLSTKGCVSNLRIFGDAFGVDGKKNDLSGLGVDFSDWVTLRYEIKDKMSTIFVNDELVLKMPADFTPLKIMGLQFRFQGTGSLKHVKLSKNNGTVIFDENFEGAGMASVSSTTSQNPG